MLKIVGYVVGAVATNVYIVINEDTKECVVIDPADQGEALIERIEGRFHARPVAILLTHGHFDHIMAVKELREHFQVPVYAGEKERELLRDPSLNLSGMYGGGVSITDFEPLHEGQVLTLLGYPWQVLETPGHTVGSVSFYLPRTKDVENDAASSEAAPDIDLSRTAAPVLFSGDTLFCGSFGRTDFPGGSARELSDSIIKKLFLLPEETKVYPGHEAETSIAQEKKYNPIRHMGMFA